MHTHCDGFHFSNQWQHRRKTYREKWEFLKKKFVGQKRKKLFQTINSTENNLDLHELSSNKNTSCYTRTQSKGKLDIINMSKTDAIFRHVQCIVFNFSIYRWDRVRSHCLKKFRDMQALQHYYFPDFFFNSWLFYFGLKIVIFSSYSIIHLYRGIIMSKWCAFRSLFWI